MTRRGLLVPMLAGLGLSACAPLIGRGETLGPEGWRETHLAYGPDARQILFIARPQQAQHLPVLLVLSGAAVMNEDQALARRLADQGVVAVVVGRRANPVGVFPAYTSDAARAVAYVTERADALGGHRKAVGVLGLGAGVRPALMLVHDGRYLASAGMTGRLPMVAVLGEGEGADPTLTHPSAYAPPAGAPRLWKGSEGDEAQAVTALKQHLNRCCHSLEL